VSDIKTQTINLDVFHFEMKLYPDFTFTISFWGKRVKGSDSNRVKINMNFKFYWVRHFYSELKSISNKARENVNKWGVKDNE